MKKKYRLYRKDFHDQDIPAFNGTTFSSKKKAKEFLADYLTQTQEDLYILFDDLGYKITSEQGFKKALRKPFDYLLEAGQYFCKKV